MSKTLHSIYIGSFVSIVLAIFIILTFRGTVYYRIPIEERFYHPDNAILKPSGSLGHFFGISGSLLIVTGVASYMARKRYRFLERVGRLKHWLEFHIFLCTLGPVLILFHTAYKFGGLVAISFWSMVAVVISGIIGRFIYLQIPRTIEGKELSLGEIRGMKTDVTGMLKDEYHLDNESLSILADSIDSKSGITGNMVSGIFKSMIDDRKTIKKVRHALRQNSIPAREIRRITALVRKDIKINHRIERLSAMQNFFRYWHVIHSPFALVMLIIMVIHVGVVIAFGYRWIF